MAESSVASNVMEHHSLLSTNFPVLLPDLPQLQFTKPEYETYVKTLLAATESKSVVSSSQSQDGDGKDAKDGSMQIESTKTEETPEAPFITGLLADKATIPSFDDRDGKMLTENADVAHSTSGRALVDLFFELEDVISAARLKEVLEKAWEDDAEATLKIIWNARSIHLGKSSRNTFYRAVGWLAENHPVTFVTNLPWLVRPLIQKKAPKKDDEKKDADDKDIEMVDAKEADSDFELVDEEGEELKDQPEHKKPKLDTDAELAQFDVKYGVAHGYWKDLLNLLALAANDQLKVDGNPKSVFNVHDEQKPKNKDWTAGRKKTVIAERHARVLEKLENDALYKALHLTVARLFADQLNLDLQRYHSSQETGKKAELKQITLAAKWAPTHKGMHDQHTCIVSSIAELLYPAPQARADGVDPANRELYLRHARLAYQMKTLSPLRKQLEVVERRITDESFDKIRYERVPSLAMKQYTPLFAKKDTKHFEQYIEKVASGKAKISGATLLPSTLVSAVINGPVVNVGSKKTKGADQMVQNKIHEMQIKVIDGQWNTLVQRIKDSGTLQSSIAVCDVSGSMSGPTFADGTNPMASSIGLSLLLAEVTEPPFGGAFITFSHAPQVLRVGGKDDTRSFAEKVRYIERSPWGGNTNFVAVFENLILPMAIENKLTQEDMVKQIFVFSDMQFDSANGSGERWTTSYERIAKKFKDAGYEMPRLIFWNLAGGRAGYDSFDLGEDAGNEDKAPKPVTAAEEGTALVSGYSQGQLKMFLDNGSFEDPEEEEAEEEVKVNDEAEDGMAVVEKVKEKKKQDPLAVVRKAISHEAYKMLKVVD